MSEVKKSVVLFSGGMDSTAILSGFVRSQGAENVIALTILYGQKHSKELEHAKQIAEYLGVRHIIQDLTPIFQYEENNPLLGDGEIPQGGYKEGIAPTYIPNRNGLFLNIAATIALSFDFNTVVFGAHADDIVGNAYPDCSPEFARATHRAIYIGSGEQVAVDAPFVSLSKMHLARYGVENGAPLEMSWSCYEGGEHHCGTCATCVDRKKAFKEAGLSDPTIYANEL